VNCLHTDSKRLNYCQTLLPGEAERKTNTHAHTKSGGGGGGGGCGGYGSGGFGDPDIEVERRPKKWVGRKDRGNMSGNIRSKERKTLFSTYDIISYVIPTYMHREYSQFSI